MEKAGDQGYEWDKNQSFDSSNHIEYWNENPKINDDLKDFVNIEDYFKYFLNTEMVALIVIYSNQKLNREILKYPSKLKTFL